MAKKIQTDILNYRVIIEKDAYEDGTIVFNASCPTLGVYDYGKSIDEVLKSIQEGIEGVIEYLTEQKQEIPVDRINESMVTFTEVKVSSESARLVIV